MTAKESKDFVIATQSARLASIAWPAPTKYVFRGRQRFMETPDGTFPGVTTVLKALGLSTEALIAWSAREERKACLSAASDLYAAWRMDPKPPESFGITVEGMLGAAKQHQKLLNKAGEIGTAIHDMIHWHLKLQLGLDTGRRPDLSEPAEHAFRAWLLWWQDSGLKPLRMEQPVWYREAIAEHRGEVLHSGFCYAGTVDLIAEGPVGLEICDWKSGRGIYDDYHLQVAAYCEAVEQLTDQRISRARIVRVPKSAEDPPLQIAELGVLYQKPRRRTRDELFSAFRGAWAAWSTLLEPEA